LGCSVDGGIATDTSCGSVSEYAGTTGLDYSTSRSEHPDEIVQQFRVSKQLGDFRNYIMSDSPGGALWLLRGR